SVLVNNEDGILYRWNLMTETLTEAITITAGLGEAYTPTLVGPDGTVYAINNATLFAVGAPIPTWAKDDSTSLWSDPASWAGGVPNAVGATALLGGTINAARQVNVDAPVIVGSLNFSNPNS